MKKQVSPNIPRDKNESSNLSGSFPVAAIGGSAGAIEAISTLLENLSPDNNIAYVIIQHLSPDHKSLLPEILTRKTNLPVHTVTRGMQVKPNEVFVIPPATNMQLVNGHFTLTKRNTKKIHLPINEFFNSFAGTYRERSIGIVLSGTQSDGTAGLISIKEEGGITFAQDDSAEFGGMPYSAIHSGKVDFILPPEKIAHELNQITRSPYNFTSPEVLEENREDFNQILQIIFNKKNVDFSNYKKSTIYRRILRRVSLSKCGSISEYLDMINTNNTESDLLFNDLLINVTSFFRDPALIDIFNKKILPALIENRKVNDPLRFWIPACSTGEEVYTFAICIFEYLSKRSLNLSFHIFGTDVNPLSIEKARAGIYNKNDLEHITLPEIENYFVKKDNKFQVSKVLRDACVFANHNLLTDPPFSRIDVVSCQNVMIYFLPDAQQKALQVFHYALKPDGFLILGKSESTGEESALFELFEKDSKIFTKKGELSPGRFNFSFNLNRHDATRGINPGNENMRVSGDTDIEREQELLLLGRYTPPGVLVNKDLHIVRFNGNMSKYLQPASGKASWYLLKMLKDEFIIDTRSLFSKIKKTGLPATKKGVPFVYNDIPGSVTLEMVPLKASARDQYYLLLFIDEPLQNIHKKEITDGSAITTGLSGSEEILRAELRETREQITTISQEFELMREQLQSSNEEVLSSNEELQSINEELETSKEELQSTNEELINTNEELQQRNSELREAYDYRSSIVETIREPLLVLDTSMKVITANKAFYQTFKTTAAETEGINFYQVSKKQWDLQVLKKQLKDIISDKSNYKDFQLEVPSGGTGNRTLAFKVIRMDNNGSNRNRILMVIDDISEKIRSQELIRKSNEKNLEILNSISDIFVSVNDDWSVSFINKSAEALAGKKAKDVLGKNIWDLFPEYVNSEFSFQLVKAMENKHLIKFEFFDTPKKQWYTYRFYPGKEGLTIYATNITEQKTAIELSNQSKERYRTFISKSAEGICRFELDEPVSTKLPRDLQVREILKHAYIAECNDAIAHRFGFRNASEVIGISMKELIASTELVNYLPQFIDSGYYLNDVEIREIVFENNEKYFLNNLVGIVENDVVKRIWGTKRDITDQKQAQNKLKNTQNKLNLALSAGSVAVWIWNIPHNQIEWSKEQQYLYGFNKKKEFFNLEEWIKFIHPEDAGNVQKAISDSLMMKTEMAVEFRIVSFDESIRWILLKAIPHYDASGNPLELAGVNIDITDRILLEKEREGFISITSHELKTPLTSIKAYAEILHEILLEKEDHQNAKLMKKMGNQIDRLHYLIKDLLDVTKIREGQLQLQTVEFDFDKLLEEVVEDMQSTTRQHIIVNKAKTDQHIFADPNKIREVLINLISNAIKYSPGTGRIEIHAHTREKELVVSVKDFGIGIAQHNLPKLFNRFMRVNDSTINTFPGLGLGLFISAEIIKKHNGTIWAESEEGKGSEFIFTIPLEKP